MEKKKSVNLKSLTANILLLFAAMIWGSAFIAQDKAGETLGVFSVNFSRFIIGAVILIPMFIITIFKDKKNGVPSINLKIKSSVIGGFFCGLALFCAAALQQLGISSGTDAGNAGFITVMYVVIVPILGLPLKKRVGPLAWMGVFIAPVGLYFLCIKDNLSFALNDIIICLSAIVFAFHILTVDHFSPKAYGVLLSSVQFFTVAILSFICMLIFEPGSIAAIPTAYSSILYLGIMSCGVAYTLQVVAQKNTNPTLASLLMSLESVFAMIFGALILNQIPNNREIFGAALIFFAVILAQIPDPILKRRDRK